MKVGKRRRRLVPGIYLPPPKKSKAQTPRPQCITCGLLADNAIHLNCQKLDGHLLVWVAIKEREL